MPFKFLLYLPWESYQLSKINITWGNTMYDHCQLNFTMKELRQRYKDNMTPNYKTGLIKPHLYEVWVCVEKHFCSTHPTDQVVMNSLCYTLTKWAVYQKPQSCTYTPYRKSSDWKTWYLFRFCCTLSESIAKEGENAPHWLMLLLLLPKK